MKQQRLQKGKKQLQSKLDPEIETIERGTPASQLPAVKRIEVDVDFITGMTMYFNTQTGMTPAELAMKAASPTEPIVGWVRSVMKEAYLNISDVKGYDFSFPIVKTLPIQELQPTPKDMNRTIVDKCVEAGVVMLVPPLWPALHDVDVKYPVAAGMVDSHYASVINNTPDNIPVEYKRPPPYIPSRVQVSYSREIYNNAIHIATGFLYNEHEAASKFADLVMELKKTVQGNVLTHGSPVAQMTRLVQATANRAVYRREKNIPFKDYCDLMMTIFPCKKSPYNLPYGLPLKDMMANDPDKAVFDVFMANQRRIGDPVAASGLLEYIPDRPHILKRAPNSTTGHFHNTNRLEARWSEIRTAGQLMELVQSIYSPTTGGMISVDEVLTRHSPARCVTLGPKPEVYKDTDRTRSIMIPNQYSQIPGVFVMKDVFEKFESSQYKRAVVMYGFSPFGGTLDDIVRRLDPEKPGRAFYYYYADNANIAQYHYNSKTGEPMGWVWTSWDGVAMESCHTRQSCTRACGYILNKAWDVEESVLNVDELCRSLIYKTRPAINRKKGKPVDPGTVTSSEQQPFKMITAKYDRKFNEVGQKLIAHYGSIVDKTKLSEREKGKLIDAPIELIQNFRRRLMEEEARARVREAFLRDKTKSQLDFDVYEGSKGYLTAVQVQLKELTTKRGHDDIKGKLGEEKALNRILNNNGSKWFRRRKKLAKQRNVKHVSAADFINSLSDADRLSLSNEVQSRAKDEFEEGKFRSNLRYDEGVLNKVRDAIHGLRKELEVATSSRVKRRLHHRYVAYMMMIYPMISIDGMGQLGNVFIQLPGLHSGVFATFILNSLRMCEYHYHLRRLNGLDEPLVVWDNGDVSLSQLSSNALTDSFIQLTKESVVPFEHINKVWELKAGETILLDLDILGYSGYVFSYSNSRDGFVVLPALARDRLVKSLLYPKFYLKRWATPRLDPSIGDAVEEVFRETYRQALLVVVYKTLFFIGGFAYSDLAMLLRVSVYKLLQRLGNNYDLLMTRYSNTVDQLAAQLVAHSANPEDAESPDDEYLQNNVGNIINLIRSELRRDRVPSFSSVVRATSEEAYQGLVDYVKMNKDAKPELVNLLSPEVEEEKTELDESEFDFEETGSSILESEEKKEEKSMWDHLGMGTLKFKPSKPKSFADLPKEATLGGMPGSTQYPTTTELAMTTAKEIGLKPRFIGGKKEETETKEIQESIEGDVPMKTKKIDGQLIQSGSYSGVGTETTTTPAFAGEIKPFGSKPLPRLKPGQTGEEALSESHAHGILNIRSTVQLPWIRYFLKTKLLSALATGYFTKLTPHPKYPYDDYSTASLARRKGAWVNTLVSEIQAQGEIARHQIRIYMDTKDVKLLFDLAARDKRIKFKEPLKIKQMAEWRERRVKVLNALRGKLDALPAGFYEAGLLEETEKGRYEKLDAALRTSFFGYNNNGVRRFIPYILKYYYKELLFHFVAYVLRSRMRSLEPDDDESWEEARDRVRKALKDEPNIIYFIPKDMKLPEIDQRVAAKYKSSRSYYPSQEDVSRSIKALRSEKRKPQISKKKQRILEKAAKSREEQDALEKAMKETLSLPVAGLPDKGSRSPLKTGRKVNVSLTHGHQSEKSSASETSEPSKEGLESEEEETPLHAGDVVYPDLELNADEVAGLFE